MDDGINGIRFYGHIHSKRSTIIALLMEYAEFRLNPIYLRINLCIIFKKLTCNFYHNRLLGSARPGDLIIFTAGS